MAYDSPWDNVCDCDCVFSYSTILTALFSPNVLALNVVHTLVGSFIMLTVSIAVAGLLLYYFHLSTKRIALASSREGLQGKDTGAGWGVIFASFILTVIYLPLSTVSVHALLWSEDFWVVPNPYTNATTLPPSLPSLGPASEFRDPLDFCYTTTMIKNQINFAPLLVILAVLTFIFVRSRNFAPPSHRTFADQWPCCSLLYGFQFALPSS